jgi:hypothetical protein
LLVGRARQSDCQRDKRGGGGAWLCWKDEDEDDDVIGEKRNWS